MSKHARRRHSHLRPRGAGTTGTLALVPGAGVAPAVAAEKSTDRPMTTAASLDAAQAPGSSTTSRSSRQAPGACGLTATQIPQIMGTIAPTARSRSNAPT